MISTNIKEAVYHLNQDKIIGLPTENRLRIGRKCV
jgi:hypothetical protein